MTSLAHPSDVRLVSPSRFSPALALGAIALIILVGVSTWFAGVQYGRLKNQQLVSELTDSQRTTTKLRLQLNEQQQVIRNLESALKSTGTDKTEKQLEAMRAQILRLQAQVDQSESSTDLDRQLLNDNAQLVRALSSPGAHLLPLRGLQSAAQSVGYAVVSTDREIIVIVSSLPNPGSGRDYQLWVRRKEDPKLVSGGVFSPDDSHRALVRFSAGDLAAEIVSLQVTEEPLGGSESPTGAVLFTSEEEEKQ